MINRKLVIIAVLVFTVLIFDKAGALLLESPSDLNIQPSSQDNNSESTSQSTVNAFRELVPVIGQYLGLENGEINDLYENAKGSYMYNAIFWLTLPVVDEVLRDKNLNDYGYDDIVNEEIAIWQREGIEINKSWDEMIRKNARQKIATDILVRQIIDSGKAVTVNSVIQHISDNYNVSSEQIQGLVEELEMRSFIKNEYGTVLGNYSLDYQKENLTDREFIDKIFKDKMNFVLSLYREYEGNSEYPEGFGFFLDSSGAVDSNIAAMGMGMAAVTLFAQKGLLNREEAEGIVNKCLNSIKYILDNQPKGEDVTAILSKFPFPILKGIVEEAQASGKNISEINLLDVYAKSEEIKNADTGGELIKNYLKKEGVEVVKDSVYYLNQDYVSALRNLVDQGGIDKVEKYGWGGLLYHFINPENRERSKIDVEMSSMDTQLMRVYALYPAVEFGGDIARKAYEIFDAFDYSENSPFFRNNDKGYGHGWHLVPDVAANDEPTGLMNNMEYHGDERLILDLARMIGLGRARSYYPETTAEYQAINSEYLNAVDHLYAEGKQIGSTDLTGKFYPTWQGASWTYEYAHSIFDFRNKYDKNGVTEDLNWFTNSVKGLLANRLYALEQGNEPYQAVIGSQEVPVEGYVMHYGSLPSISRILSPDSPSSVPSSDGTFSPSQTNLSFTPFESLESLWMQYLSNPMLAQGRYGFRDSFNEEANFWAPGNYLLNEAQFLFKTENALTGLVWDTLGRDPYVAQVMKDAFDQGDAIQEVNDLANLTDFQGSTFEDASFLVGSIIEEAKKMVEVQDESKLEYFRDFINNNDNLYQKALDILNTLAPSVETEALKCVIYKNQKQPDELLYVAGNLITELNNNPGKLADAVDIISKYDYEATVMWKGYDSVNGFIPVMSHVDDDGTIDIKGEIENNLQRAIALNSPNELLPEELRELLTTQRKLYTLFSEDAGVISTLIEGANLSNGKHIKGFRELAEEKGLIGARQIFTEEFEALSALRSYVEFSLGRELNLLSPTGEDSGYLSGLSNMIEGGLQELGGWQQFLRWMAKDGSGSYTFEEVADDLLVTGQLRAFQELWFGRPLDLVNSDADNTNLSPYVKKVTQEGKSIELQISHMLSETPTRYCDLNISSIQGLIVQGKDMYEYTTHMRANINPLGGSYQYKLEVTVSYENGAQKVYTFNNLNGSRAQEVTVPLYDDPNIFLDSVTIGGVTRDLYILSHPKNIVFRIIEGGGE